MRKLHDNPTMFIQIVENALNQIYLDDSPGSYARWEEIQKWYMLRYLNPDSPEKQSFKKLYERS